MRVSLPLMKNIISLLSLKRLLDYTDSFFPKEYEKNNKIILKYLKSLETKNLLHEKLAVKL